MRRLCVGDKSSILHFCWNIVPAVTSLGLACWSMTDWALLFLGLFCAFVSLIDELGFVDGPFWPNSCLLLSILSRIVSTLNPLRGALLDGPRIKRGLGVLLLRGARDVLGARFHAALFGLVCLR